MFKWHKQELFGDMAGEAAMENATTDTQTQLDKLLQLDEKAAKEQYEP